MEDYKGTILKFDESSYLATLNKFNPVLRAVNEVGTAYEELDTTFKFTHEVFEDIVANEIANISLRYAAVVEDQIKASKFTSKAIITGMRENVSKELSILSLKIKALHNAHRTVSSGVNALPIDLEFIKIENGTAVLNDASKEAIREAFTIKVRTEEQNKLYNLLLNMKEHYENLTSFMTDSGIDVKRWGEIISDTGNGLCYEQAGELIIYTDSINIKLKNNGSAKQQLLEVAE